MAIREQERRAGAFGVQLAGNRGIYDDINVDPFAGRSIKKGKRQTDAANILAHGERSDTDWGNVIRDSAVELRRTYAPLGEWSPITNQADKDLRNVIWGRPKQYQFNTSRDLTDDQRAADLAKGTAFNKQAQIDFDTERSASMARWMAAYNENVNVSERIGISKRRQRHRERFADMQIQRERTQAKKTRDTLKKGASGLSVSFGSGAGTGLGIPT